MCTNLCVSISTSYRILTYIFVAAKCRIYQYRSNIKYIISRLLFTAERDKDKRINKDNTIMHITLTTLLTACSMLFTHTAKAAAEELKSTIVTIEEFAKLDHPFYYSIH